MEVRPIVVSHRVDYRYKAHKGDISGEIYLFIVEGVVDIKEKIFEEISKEIQGLDIKYLVIDNVVKLEKNIKIDKHTGRIL
jgi:predicted transcriptional regulator